MEYYDLIFEFDGQRYIFTCTYEIDDSTGLCFDDTDIMIRPEEDYVSILALLKDDVVQAIMIQLQEEVEELHW
jgi:hypothetical protein